MNVNSLPCGHVENIQFLSITQLNTGVAYVYRIYIIIIN